MPMTAVEILRAACCVAGLDQQIDERELKLLRKLADRAGVGAVSLTAMIDRARQDGDFYKEQFRVVLTDAEETMRILVRVAIADGVLSPDERIVLTHFAERLGMDDARFDKYLAAAEQKVPGARGQTD